MKKTVLATFVVLFISLPFLSFAQTKIGYVSVDEIFALMPETKKADQNLAEFQNALQESYAQQEAELNAAFDKFIKDSLTMTPSVKEAKRTDLQSRVNEMQKKPKEMNNTLELEKENQIKPIREKLLATIKEVAKAMGYDHVLYKESALVFPAAADLTNAVKNKLGIK